MPDNLFDHLFIARMLGGPSLEREVLSRAKTEDASTILAKMMTDPVANAHAQGRIGAMFELLPAD